MPPLYLFEDSQVDRLYPLTYARGGVRAADRDADDAGAVAAEYRDSGERAVCARRDGGGGAAARGAGLAVNPAACRSRMACCC